MLIKKTQYLVIWALGLLLITGCSPTYDQVSLDNAKKLKRESLVLMDSAKDPFSSHSNDVTKIKKEMEDACSHSESLNCNCISVSMWDIIKDPEGHSFGGFLKKWETDNTIGNVMIERSEKVVEKQYTELIDHENQKRK
jgi:hypothetical protein